MAMTDARIREVIVAIENAFEGDDFTDAWARTPWVKREAMRKRWAEILKDATCPDRDAPIADAELAALGALAMADEIQMTRANDVRYSLGQAPAFNEIAESIPTGRLRAELQRRGVL